MQREMVWFILGVLVGSLFFVSAYPTDREIQYSAPVIQKIAGSNYTAYVLYPKNGLPLSPQFLKQTIPRLVEKSAPNAKWHVYAVPELPKGSVITGYGIKVTEDGRVDILITATGEDATIQAEKVKNELLQWSRKAPEFKPDIVPKEKIGVPKGWEVKTVDSNGNVRVYSGESSPYWHEIGSSTIHNECPPAGNVYARTYFYQLENDNDPQRNYFLAASGPNGEGVYEIDPGYGLWYNGNHKYDTYHTDTAKIINKWGLDSSIDPLLEVIKPVNTIYGHTTTTVTIGYSPFISFTVTVPDSKMTPVADRSTQTATWILDFDSDSNDAKFTFGTMVASEGSVGQAEFHDGNWHDIVDITLWARFRKHWYYHYDVQAGVKWSLKG
ncbi:hypothetical protein [Thermococcus stetteri]|uniref:hypothetical protein n=1 Tax=Thermococcus stetteri TaxID=49900 RepID=UPI001AE293E0|nr:hypothetical protein [Thermococcus stetteri]MBP1910866.1 hypothetical protein [Thermococcus stetteri]